MSRNKTIAVLLLTGALVLGMSGIALATLTGSSFESGDGNLALDASVPGDFDWNHPIETINCPASAPGAGMNCGLDLVKNGADNSLGQGTKEDDPVPTIVDGSIPPSKDDLSRFYVNQERTGADDFLYLAWERSNLLGSAHMDFEFNQNSTPSSNGVTPVRTEGDMLIDFDFGGSGVPVLALHRWIIDNGIHTAAECEANNTLPCWNKAVDLSGFAEGQVNSASVTDTNPPNAPFTLAANTKNGINSTFGEAGINLTAAGVFPRDRCVHFGAAMLKSRSSGNSFTSEMKDFIAPIPVDISNCGTVIIIKRTIPRGLDQDFSYSTTGGLNPATFTLNDKGNTTADSATNTRKYENVFAGSYAVTENAVPAGFAFDHVSCEAKGGGTSATPTGQTVNITLAPSGVVTCTYYNQQQLGAILVTKTRKTPGSITDQPQANVSFTVNGVTKQTNSSGQACFDGLPFGTYTVHETVPTGYVGEGDKSVKVDTNTTCAAVPYVGETVSFKNTPLTDLVVTATAQDKGATKTRIECVDSSNAAIGNSPVDYSDPASFSAKGLKPGTYVCTVIVDP